MRVIIYARHSSDLQNPTSTDDQVRLVKELAEKQGWTVVAIYTDPEISGAFILNRPGVQKLLAHVKQGDVDVVACEALDRITRDQEDIAAIFKRIKFTGAMLFTLAEGEINELHIGLKGTMNAIFLKDLAHKTRRGLRGRVEQGKSGGGITFGFDNVKRIDPVTNDYARGERAINEIQAGVVRRIFKEYIVGVSPRTIAMTLNKEGIAGPQGGAWVQVPSTEIGSVARAS